MAKFPKWSADLVPTGGGPLIVRQPNAGQAGAALSGLGRSMAGLGQYLTKEAKEAAEKTAELDRIRQASTATRQASQELRKFADEIRRDPEPGNYERRFEEVSQSVLAGIDAIEDPEVKTRVQTQIDSDLDFHYRDMLTHRMEKQQQAFEREYTAAEKQAVRTGDVELVEKPLQDLQAVGLLSQEQAAEYLAKTRAKTLVWQTAIALGWKEGQKYIADPQTWKDVPLGLEEMSAFKGLIESNLRSQEAIEGREALLQAAKTEQAKSGLFADALAGKLDDPMKIDLALRAQVVTPAEAKDLYRLVRDGAPETNDFEALAKINQMIDGIERGQYQTSDVLKEIDRNVTKLTPAKRDSLIERATNVFSFQNRAMSDARRYAISQLVTVNESMLERLYSMGTSTETLKPIEDRRAFEYRLVEYVEDQLGSWIQAHPEATPDDVQVHGRRLISQVRSMDQARRRSMLDAWETTETVSTTTAATPWEGPNEGVLMIGEAPRGLESVWESLSAEERDSARAFLRDGGTVEQVLEALR